MRMRKKYCLILLLIVTVLSMGTVASAASAKNKAMQAFKTYLTDNESSIESFSVAYITNKKVPEVLVSSSDSNYMLIYKKNKVKSVAMPEQPVAYSPHKGVIRGVSSIKYNGNSYGYVFHHWYKLNGAKTKFSSYAFMKLYSVYKPYYSSQYVQGWIGKKSFSSQSAFNKKEKALKIYNEKYVSYHVNNSSNRYNYLK